MDVCPDSQSGVRQACRTGPSQRDTQFHPVRHADNHMSHVLVRLPWILQQHFLNTLPSTCLSRNGANALTAGSLYSPLLSLFPSVLAYMLWADSATPVIPVHLVFPPRILFHDHLP